MISELSNDFCEYVNNNTPDQSSVLTSGRAIVYEKNKIKHKFSMKLHSNTSIIVMFYAGKYGNSTKRLWIETKWEIDVSNPNWMAETYEYINNTATSHQNRF